MENARLKALYYAAATGLPSVADDSGLEIEALDNAPGVHSARWHGTDYAVKFRMIYQLLRERGLDTSPARFVAAVAFAEDGRIAFEGRGVVEGEIAREPAGTHGFGYDPIFYYPPLRLHARPGRRRRQGPREPSRRRLPGVQGLPARPVVTASAAASAGRRGCSDPRGPAASCPSSRPSGRRG